ncbi:hypothetical protein ATS71_16080 [Pseudoalteromonas sp. H71]|nr:hypothetical protein ATS71_16080 [Pseudoalteromonas sp. H71]
MLTKCLIVFFLFFDFYILFKLLLNKGYFLFRFLFMHIPLFLLGNYSDYFILVLLVMFMAFFMALDRSVQCNKKSLLI